MTDIIPRVLTAAAAAASLAHVGVLIPRYILSDPAVPTSIRIFIGSIVVTVAAALAGSVLALVLVARSWERPGARSLALFLAAVSTLWGSILRLIDIEAGGNDVQIQLHASSSLQVALLSSAIIIAGAAFLRFSALFPVPLEAAAMRPPRRLRSFRRVRIALLRARPVWLTAAAAVAITAAYGPVTERVLALILTGSLRTEGMLAGNATARGIWIGGLVTISVVTLLIMPVTAMVLGMRNLAVSYRVAAPDERRRLLWLVAGVSIAGWMILAPLLAIPLVALTPLSVDWMPYAAGLLWFFAPAVLVGSAAVAIFYSGAVDPALVLKRSTVFGILGAIAFVLFTALESLLSNLFEATLGLPGLVGSIIAGCVAAGLMVPVRRMLARVSIADDAASDDPPGVLPKAIDPPTHPGSRA